MNNLRLNLVSVTTVEFLTVLLPVAKSIRSADELRAFRALVDARYRRLAKEFPEQTDDLAAVIDCLSGTADAAVEN